MSKSKKPRKAKRHLRNPVTIWHVLMARTDQPIPIADRIRIAVGTRESFDRVRTGTASIDDWQCVADCVTMTETIVLFKGWAEDPSGLLADAAKAIIEAQRRMRNGQPGLLSGPGLQAVACVIEDYQQLLNALTERQMVEAERLTAERYKLLIQGKKFTKIFDEELAREVT